MSNWKDKLIRFMYGRYGTDALYGFLQFVFWACLIVNLFVRSTVLSVVTWILIVLIFFRFFSRNIEQRRKENEMFLKAFGPVKSFFSLQLMKAKGFKTRRYRRCPYCRTILRLPIKKGKHVASCPVCHKDVNVTIWF